MYSKISFDLGNNNSPVIKAEVTSSSDMRDKVAKQFFDNLALGNLISARCLHTKDFPTESGGVSKNVWELKSIQGDFIPYEVIADPKNKIVGTMQSLHPTLEDVNTKSTFSFVFCSEDVADDFEKWKEVNPGPYKFEIKDPFEISGKLYKGF